MNFWTFLDRNGEGAVIIVALLIAAIGFGVPASIHEMRTPRDCKPCVCGEVRP